MASPDAFLDELRKRGVVRAGLIYAAAAFAVLEFAEIAFPRLGLPDGAVTIVLGIGLAGFPLILGLAWVFDIRAGRDAGVHRRWFAPSTVLTSGLLVALGIGMGVWWGSTGDAPGSETHQNEVAAAVVDRGPAVAVLRFSDLGASDEHAYFAAGLSEEISSALSRFPGIRVIAPSASGDFGAAQETEPVQGVRYLLRGSVRRGVTQVRVSTQLVDTTVGQQIWGESYDSDLSTAELLATQDRIASQVAASIADSSGAITRASQADARRRRSDEFEAYDCVLLGHAYLEIHTGELHARALECLERAVVIAPDYADAWAHLAYVRREEFHHGWTKRPDALDRALEAGRRAVELDASNAMAHYALAMTFFSRNETEAGVAAAERAVELNPSDTAAMGALALYFVYTGHAERGVQLARTAAELNPLHPGWLNMAFAVDHYMRGEYEQGLISAERANLPEDVQTATLVAANLGRLGRASEAVSSLDVLRADERFAANPVAELNRYFVSEDIARALSEGLYLAGLSR